jgi:hypothetical protein
MGGKYSIGRSLRHYKGLLSALDSAEFLFHGCEQIDDAVAVPLDPSR